MKRIFLLLLSIVMTSALWIGHCQCLKSFGKSMGQWENFSIESMKQNRKEGLKYIEVTMSDVIGKDTAEVRDRASLLKEQIESAGLKIWSVHLPYSKLYDISIVDDVKRADAVNYIKDIANVASIFQPKFVVLSPSYDNVAPDERGERLANCHASIGEIAPVVEAYGATLCVENLPRTCLGRNGQEMMFLIGGYDNVGICFDVNHLIYQSHEDFLKNIDKGTIKMVHLSDYNFTDERHLLPGVGHIDWKPLWEGIKDNGYKGIFMFECDGNAPELAHARDIVIGKVVPTKSNLDADSLGFCNAEWQITDLGRGAQAMYAQAPMFFSTQSICCIKYPASAFKSEILHRPGDKAGKPSELGKEIGIL